MEFFWLPFARLHGSFLARTTIFSGMELGIYRAAKSTSESRDFGLVRLVIRTSPVLRRPGAREWRSAAGPGDIWPEGRLPAFKRTHHRRCTRQSSASTNSYTSHTNSRRPEDRTHTILDYIRRHSTARAHRNQHHGYLIVLHVKEPRAMPTLEAARGC